MPRTRKELFDYLRVQGLANREEGVTPDGAQVLFMLVTLLSGEEARFIAALKRRHQAETPDNVEIEVVSGAFTALRTMLSLMLQHSRLGEACAQLMEEVMEESESDDA